MDKSASVNPIIQIDENEDEKLRQLGFELRFCYSERQKTDAFRYGVSFSRHRSSRWYQWYLAIEMGNFQRQFGWLWDGDEE